MCCRPPIYRKWCVLWWSFVVCCRLSYTLFEILRPNLAFRTPLAQNSAISAPLGLFLHNSSHLTTQNVSARKFCALLTTDRRITFPTTVRKAHFRVLAPLLSLLTDFAPLKTVEIHVSVKYTSFLFVEYSLFRRPMEHYRLEPPCTKRLSSVNSGLFAPFFASEEGTACATDGKRLLLRVFCYRQYLFS